MKKILLLLLGLLLLTGCGSKVNEEWTDDDLKDAVLGASAIVTYNKEFTLYDKEGNSYIVDCAYLDQLMASNVNNDCNIEYLVKYYEKDNIRHIVKFQYRIDDKVYESGELEDMNLVISKACSIYVPNPDDEENVGFIGIWQDIKNYKPTNPEKPIETKPDPKPEDNIGKEPVVDTGVR